MTHETPDFHLDEIEETLVLNRPQLAKSLREQGIDVDFEDWDGLSDESVTRIASVLVDNDERRRGRQSEI